MKHLDCLVLCAALLTAASCNREDATDPAPSDARPVEATPETQPSAPQPAPESTKPTEEPPKDDALVEEADEEPPKAAPAPASPGQTFFQLASKEGGGEDFEDDEFRVFSTVDGSIFFTHGPWVLPVDDTGTLVEDPEWLKGLDFEDFGPYVLSALVAWNVHELGGRFPEGLFMTTSGVSTFRFGPFPQRAYKWTGNGWKMVGDRNEKFWSFPDRLSGWVDGAVLAHRSFGHRYRKEPSEDYEPSAAEVRACDDAIASARSVAVVVGAGKAPAQLEKFGLVRAIETGHAIGYSYSPSASRVAHYSHERGDVVMRELPGGDEPDVEGLEIFAGDRAYAFGSRSDGDDETPYIARFDGETWTEVPGPDCGHKVFALGWAPNANLHVLCDRPLAYTVYPAGTLWEQAADGTWSRTDFGGTEKEWVTGLVVRSDGQRWIATRRGAYGTVEPRKTVEVENLSKVVKRLFPDYDPEG